MVDLARSLGVGPEATLLDVRVRFRWADRDARRRARRTRLHRDRHEPRGDRMRPRPLRPGRRAPSGRGERRGGRNDDSPTSSASTRSRMNMPCERSLAWRTRLAACLVVAYETASSESAPRRTDPRVSTDACLRPKPDLRHRRQHPRPTAVAVHLRPQGVRLDEAASAAGRAARPGSVLQVGARSKGSAGLRPPRPYPRRAEADELKGGGPRGRPQALTRDDCVSPHPTPSRSHDSPQTARQTCSGPIHP